MILVTHHLNLLPGKHTHTYRHALSSSVIMALIYSSEKYKNIIFILQEYFQSVFSLSILMESVILESRPLTNIFCKDDHGCLCLHNYSNMRNRF